MPSNSSTSLYGATSGNVTVSSNNLTTLYSGSGINIRPTVGYGNANVERFLSIGTDGGNTVTNIVNSGTITSGGNITAPWFIGNVIGNITGNIVVPGSNTQVLYNNNGNAGASADLTFNDSTNLLDVNGNVDANYFIGNGSQLSSLTGANVTGQVPFAAVANSVAVANVSGIGNVAVLNLDGSASNVLYGNGVFAPGGGGNAANANYANFAGTAFSVSVGNVSGIGNIATINLDGNAGNILYGNGSFSAAPTVSNVANANYANFAGTAFNVSGSNVSGAVANANYANFSGTAFSVSGSNVSGAVANATFANSANTANSATVANSSNSVAVGNVVGIGNIATINLTGSSSNVLYGNGVFAPESTTIANANYANFAGTAFNVSGSNVSGIVANANYAAFANVANVANSVAVANVSGIGNIAIINLDGSSSNVLYGNGVFAPESTTIANANYANFAGTVITNAQPNITSVGNLPYLQVSNSANSTGVIRQTSSGNVTFTTSAANTATYQITTQYHPNNNVGYPSDRYIRSRGNVTNPATVASGDRILARSGHGFNGNTNPLSVAETFTIVGLNANANALWTGGQWNITTGNPQGNSANQESLTWQNQLIFTNSGALQINPGTVPNVSAGQTSSTLLITNYGLDSANIAGAGGINQQKARGNREALLSVQPNDTLGRINFWGYNGTAYTSARVASLVAQVDSSYVANTTVIPTNMIIRTLNSSNVQLDTTFFGNGLAQFPGNISAVGNSLNITKTTGGATSLNLIGDKTPNSTFDIFDAQFSSTMSNVDTTGGFSPFRFQQYAPTNNNFGSMYMYRARGNSFANSAPVVAGDFIYSVNFQVNSNNTTVSAGSFSSSVNYNDNAGNVGTNITLNAIGTGTDGYLNGVIDLLANRTTANNFTANTITSTGNLSITGTSNIGNLQLNRFQETVYAIGNTSGTITPDFNNGSIQSMTLTGNITLNSLGNAIAGRSMTLIVTQDGTGGRTLSSTMKFSDGFSTLSASAGAEDIISVFYTGSTYYATLTTGYA